MNRARQDDLIDDYLRRLRRSSRHLPRDQRAELIAQIEEHLAEAIPDEAGPALISATLEQLGDPEELVSEQLAALGLSGRHAGGREWLTIFLLLFGGFLALIGWIVGAWMLWWSSAWTRTEKLAGSLVVPGGLLLAAALAQRLIGTGKSAPVPLTLATILAVILPLLTATFLARRARPTQTTSS